MAVEYTRWPCLHSMGSRTALLLIVLSFILVSEGHGAPHLDPEEAEKGLIQVPVVFPPNASRSRPKREIIPYYEPKDSLIDYVTLHIIFAGVRDYDAVVDFPKDRYQVLNTTEGYEDGKNCFTGQDAWHPDEYAHWYHVLKHYYSVDFYSWRRLLYAGDWKLIHPPFNGARCKSKNCYLDGESWTPTCGYPRYRNGQQCSLGIEPMTEDQAKELLPDPERDEYEESQGISDLVQKRWGNYCSSKRCYYAHLQATIICESHSVKPVFHIVAFMFALSSLPYFLQLTRRLRILLVGNQ